jgi:hypothetical protein
VPRKIANADKVRESETEMHCLCAYFASPESEVAGKTEKSNENLVCTSQLKKLISLSVKNV